jgi:hypothetical protein
MPFRLLHGYWDSAEISSTSLVAKATAFYRNRWFLVFSYHPLYGMQQLSGNKLG